MMPRRTITAATEFRYKAAARIAAETDRKLDNAETWFATPKSTSANASAAFSPGGASGP